MLPGSNFWARHRHFQVAWRLDTGTQGASCAMRHVSMSRLEPMKFERRQVHRTAANILPLPGVCKTFGSTQATFIKSWARNGLGDILTWRAAVRKAWCLQFGSVTPCSIMDCQSARIKEVQPYCHMFQQSAFLSIAIQLHGHIRSSNSTTFINILGHHDGIMFVPFPPLCRSCLRSRAPTSKSQTKPSLNRSEQIASGRCFAEEMV